MERVEEIKKIKKVIYFGREKIIINKNNILLK